MQIENMRLRKVIALTGVVIMIVSLLPILWVSRYNHPTGDDIYYGLEAHLEWKESGNIVETIGAALQGVAGDYYRWQGTFVAMLIMRLQPSVFSENLYFVTPFLVLGLLLGGLYYAISKVAKYILPMDRWDKLAIWSVVSFLMIQWVHAVGDAFYWFNGSVYYSGFFGIMLFGIGVVLEWCNTLRRRYIPIMILLAIILGGSNYITLLTSLILLTLTWVVMLWKKKNGWLVVAITDVIMLVCLVISASAPGNAVRQATCASLPAYKAILFSLFQGFAYIEVWANGWWFLGFVLLVPFVVPLIVRSKYSFSNPGIVIPILYGIFCAMQCPTMYAEASTGPGRVINVIWYGFILFSYVALFYVVGWVYQKTKAQIKLSVSTAKVIWIFMVVLLLIIQGGIGLKNDSIKNMTTMKAVSDMISGRAVSYHQEYLERLKVLQDEQIRTVEFAEFMNKPKTVYVGDYAQDPAADANVHVAKWYDKDSVCVIYNY